MTATRDRRSDPDLDAELAWDERPIIGTFRGVPWWAAVVIGFGVAAVAAFIDMQRADTLGQIYQVGYLVGCVAAVCLVRRHSLFGPMVQPPLVFAVTAIGAYVILGPPSNGGLKQLVFSVAIPLTSNFLTMATATGVTVVIGLFRLWRERDPNPRVRPSRARDRDSESRSDEPRERPRRERPAAPPRQPRTRDAEPDEQPPPRRNPRPARGEARPERAPRDRGTPRGEPRPERAARGRSRQPESPRQPRDRETPERRPRGDEPPPRRENPRGSQPRPRRRPPEDPYR